MEPRHSLASLGRHLQRSVLRTCLAPALLRPALPQAEVLACPDDAALLQAACAAVARDGPEAQVVHRVLDGLHALELARFAAMRHVKELRLRWRQAAATPSMSACYWALLTHPLADRELRQLAFADVEMLAAARPPGVAMAPTSAAGLPGAAERRLDPLLGRRSVSPRALGLPAPSAQELELILQAALTAPDHGRVRPWRVVEFRTGAREPLADLFEEEKLRRDPLASPMDRRRAREHATRPPCLLGFVVSPRQRRGVPVREQWLTAGAALGNLLNAAHALGYGAIVLSGERCFDKTLAAQLGVAEGEFLVGFVSIGTAVEAPPETGRPLPQSVWTCWTPAAHSPRMRPMLQARFAASLDDGEIA